MIFKNGVSLMGVRPSFYSWMHLICDCQQRSKIFGGLSLKSHLIYALVFGILLFRGVGGSPERFENDMTSWKLELCRFFGEIKSSFASSRSKIEDANISFNMKDTYP